MMGSGQPPWAAGEYNICIQGILSICLHKSAAYVHLTTFTRECRIFHTTHVCQNIEHTKKDKSLILLSKCSVLMVQIYAPMDVFGFS